MGQLLDRSLTSNPGCYSPLRRIPWCPSPPQCTSEGMPDVWTSWRTSSGNMNGPVSSIRRNTNLREVTLKQFLHAGRVRKCYARLRYLRHAVYNIGNHWTNLWLSDWRHRAQRYRNIIRNPPKPGWSGGVSLQKTWSYSTKRLEFLRCSCATEV